jgi:hypothetical protein
MTKAFGAVVPLGMVHALSHVALSISWAIGFSVSSVAVGVLGSYAVFHPSPSASQDGLSVRRSLRSLPRASEFGSQALTSSCACWQPALRNSVAAGIKSARRSDHG